MLNRMFMFGERKTFGGKGYSNLPMAARVYPLPDGDRAPSVGFGVRAIAVR
jgi:hypothetical protein